MKETQLVRIKMFQMAVLTIAAGLISAQEGLTFRNTFDRMSVNAEKGPRPACLNWQNPSLELRAFPGIRGQGNAVALSDTESLTYEMQDNLNPREGTVSFWFSP